jgi:S1-C subfamily serine protease
LKDHEERMVESLLIAATYVSTIADGKGLTNASGFFFDRDGKLFLVTSRHVVFDEPASHRPDQLEIEFHTDPENLAEVARVALPLYKDRQPLWRQGVDSAGPVDIAALEIERSALPARSFFSAFTPSHLITEFDRIEVGTPVLIVGFPLGFHDHVHHLPVARQAMVASAFGIRFQGQGYFLTDALLHRGASGAPVVARMSAARSGRSELPWMLLGVHAARMDVERDANVDERLNLHCAWYADILLTLTENPPGESETKSA